MSSGEAGQPCRFGACGGQAGDAEDRDRGRRSAVEVADVTFDQRDLPDMRERQVLGCGQDADGAAFDTAVASIGPGMADRRLLPRQGIERGEQFRLIFLDAEAEIRAAAVEVLGGVALGVHRVGGERSR